MGEGNATRQGAGKMVGVYGAVSGAVISGLPLSL